MDEDLNAYLPDRSAISSDDRVGRGSESESNAIYTLIDSGYVARVLKPRETFSHKGTYGHVLIIAGERETMGAALLASKGCLYAGAGLTSACIPEIGLSALNTALPEVMFLSRDKLFENPSFDKYDAVAIGPGIGQGNEAKALLSLLLESKRPVIADADALNLLASNSLLLRKLPKDSILTPHMKEFDGVFGAHETWYSRLQTARKKATELGIVIVLKNQYTFIIDQEGKVHINTSGSPAMAQGGMGDVLTGVISAYVAQGYPAKDAAILGCFIHGMAGSELAVDRFNVTASCLAEYLPIVTKKITSR